MAKVKNKNSTAAFEQALAEAKHMHLHIAAFNSLNSEGRGQDIEFCGQAIWDKMLPAMRSAWLIGKCDAEYVNGTWDVVWFDSANDIYGAETIWDDIVMDTATLIERGYLAPAWVHAREYDSAYEYVKEMIEELHLADH